MIKEVWNIIPIDPAEAMSTYSAIGFIMLILICAFLFKQNTERKIAIKELEKDLDGKEKELREHTDTEADKLHKRIEVGLNDNSNDLKEVKGTMCRVETTVIKLTTAQEYLTKTMDEIKRNIDHIRDKK